MKKLAQRLLPVTLLLAALVTACTTDEGTPAPNFPDPVEDFVEPNSTYTLHLSPNQEWMVSIPSTASDFWGIRNGEQISYSIGGPAGDVTVEIVCLAEMNDLADHEVEVSMRMGGETRVIATLTLSRGEALLNIVPAKIAEDSDGHEYFQTPAESTGFLYEYGEPLAEGAAVPMLWDATRNGYVSYIRVESNFSYGTNIETAGLRLTELQSPSASGRYSEYEIFCSQVNLGETPVSYSFDITSEVEGFEEVAVSVNAPQFVPVLEVRATVPDGDNNFQTPAGDDSPYNWLYSETPLTLSESADGTGAGNVDLLWRPSAKITEVDAYILVKANFNLTVAGAGWVSVEDGIVVEETSDNYETETYYRIYVAPSDIVTDGAKSTVTINFGDETDNVYSRTFNVKSPDITDIFYVDRVPDFTFDAEGGYQADEMGMSTNGWINHTYNWASSAAAIQSVTMTVSVAENTGDAREGLVMAFPPEVWDSILKKAAGYGDDVTMVLFDQRDGTVILPEYENYAVAYIEQNAPAGAVEPYNPDEGWASTDVGASFGNLDPNDDIYYMEGIGVSYDTPGYEITYTKIASDYEFGADTQFKVNVEYDSYKVFDMNSGILAEDQVSSYWAQFRESESTGTNYIGVAPGSAEGDAYFLLMNGNVCVAIIHIVYDSDAGGSGSLDLEMTQGAPDFTFTEYTEEGVTAPCYLLTYTGTGSGMAAISNFPATGWNFGASDWLTVNPMAGLAMFEVDPSLVTPDDNECRVTFYNESLSGIACIIICRVVTE